MKAVRMYEHGGPEVLRVEAASDPRAGAGEVVVAVTASALNHVDVDVREGTSRFPVSFPHVLGFEAVGHITQIGAGVEGWAVGDRVHPYLLNTCGRCRYCRTGRESLCTAPGMISVASDGCYQEQIRVPARQLLRVPDGISDVAAAAIPTAFATAWHMLFTRARLTTGEVLLINSVGSGIGAAALQLARLAGAYVIGTSSSEAKLEFARKRGIDATIDYTRTDVAAEVMRLTDGAGADVVFEHVGGDSFQRALDSVAKDGRIVIAGGHAGEVVPFDIIPFFRRQLAVLGSSAYTSEEVDRVYALAARGLIEPDVFRTFPLVEAAEAMRVMERREQFGKIVLTV